MDNPNVMTTETITLRHPNLAAALAAAQGEFPEVKKTRTATVQSKKEGARPYTYKYADLSDVMTAVRPILSRHEIAIMQPIITQDRETILRTKLVHASGDCEASDMPLPINGLAPQAIGSLLTYLRRYALTAALGIAAEEDDDAQAVNDDVRHGRQYQPPRRQEAPAQEPVDPVQEARRRLEASASDALAKAPVMDAAKLAATQEWMGKPAGAEMPSRWAMLAKIDPTLRDKLRVALAAREKELQPAENRQQSAPEQAQNGSPAETATQRKPGRSPVEEVEDALAHQDALREQDRKDPLGIAGMDDRRTFSALNRAMKESSAAEADHLWNTYREVIEAMPLQGKQALEAIVVGKIEAQPVEAVG